MLSICLLAHGNPLYSDFFESVELPELSTPCLQLQGSSICPWVTVSGSGYRKGVNSGSSNVGEQDTLPLAVPLPRPLSPRQYSAHVNIPRIHYSTHGKLPRPRSPNHFPCPSDLGEAEGEPRVQCCGWLSNGVKTEYRAEVSRSGMPAKACTVFFQNFGAGDHGAEK